MKKSRLSFSLLPAFLLLGSCRAGVHPVSRQTTALLAIAIIIILFVLLSRYTNILRDEVSNCDEFEDNGQKMQGRQKTTTSKKPPYSLTRAQFGLWTVIIACSYLYLSLYKSDCEEGPVNKTALVLTGIFSGTVAASAIIDKREIGDKRQRHQNTPSRGLFTDILSDDNGISLHRFQHFVWTLVAVTVYLYKLSRITTGCVLPELSDTLLSLTGISSAAYLVLRAGENGPSASDTGAAPTGPGNDAGRPGYGVPVQGFYG